MKRYRIPQILKEAKIERPTPHTLIYYGVNNRKDVTKAVKEWLDNNHTWFIPLGIDSSQYGLKNEMTVTFYCEGINK